MRRLLPWLSLVLSLLIGLWFRDQYAGSWLDVETDRDENSVAVVYQVEADAYARLARVQRILDGHGLVQRFHPQENYPEGIKPTTTLPFDLLILALYFPAKFLTAHPLDWAGALVSPALYVALTLFLFWWSREWPLRVRTLLLFGAATFPGLIWATPFARADHQSLNLFLVAIALCLEWNRWRPDASKPCSIIAGALWGLALWNSLYEPLLLFAVVLAFNLVTRRREQIPFIAATGAVLLTALVIEGFHFSKPPSELNPFLVRWLSTIGEIRSMTFYGATVYFTPAVWLLPVFLIRLIQCGDRRKEDWLLICLTFVLVVTAFFQTRWIYFASLSFLLVIACWYTCERVVWLRRVILAVVIISTMWSLDRDLEALDQRENSTMPQLRHLSQGITTPGAILAPWWLSSPLLYYSGQPIVAGSSHMTLSGIVDSARFFTTSSWIEADEILQKRQVRWVVVYMPDRTLLNSRQILGIPGQALQQTPSAQTVTERLFNDIATPTRYRLRAVDRDFRLYEYTP